jgi:hypothetical protein
MSWEQILKDQAQRATTLVGNSLTRLRNLLDDLNGPPLPRGEFSDRVARHLVRTWKDSLDLTFGLLGRGGPLPPVMFFTSASGPLPTGTVRLASDTLVGALTFTPLFALGGGAQVPAAALNTAPNLATITDGSLLTVTISALPAAVPPFDPATAPAGLYHGVVLQATQPVAVVLFQKL